MSDIRKAIFEAYERMVGIKWASSTFSAFERIIVYGLIAVIGYLGGKRWGIDFEFFAAVAALFAFLIMRSTNKIVAAIRGSK